MDELLKIDNSKQPYVFYVNEDFYKEVGKDDPLILIWLGDKNTNTICITDEIYYRNYLKKCLLYSIKKKRLEKLPEIISFINDYNTAIKIYNILSYGTTNTLKLLIDAINDQPFKLSL